MTSRRPLQGRNVRRTSDSSPAFQRRVTWQETEPRPVGTAETARSARARGEAALHASQSDDEEAGQSVTMLAPVAAVFAGGIEKLAEEFTQAHSQSHNRHHSEQDESRTHDVMIHRRIEDGCWGIATDPGHASKHDDPYQNRYADSAKSKGHLLHSLEADSD